MTSATRPPSPVYDDDAFGAYQAPHVANGSRSLKTMGLIFGVLCISLVGFLAYKNNEKKKQEAFNAYYQEARKFYRSNTTMGLERAAEKYEEAIKIDEHEPNTLSKLAWIYDVLTFDRGKKDFSEKRTKYMNLAKEYASDSDGTIAVTMREHIRKKEYDNAIKIASEMESPLPVPIEIAWSRALLEAGRFADLDTRLKAYEKSDHVMIKTVAGQAYRALGQNVKAKKALSQAISIERNHGPSRVERALLALDNPLNIDRVQALEDLAHLQDLGVTQIGTAQNGLRLVASSEFKRIIKKNEESDRDLGKAKEILGSANSTFAFYNAKRFHAVDKKEKALSEIEKSTKGERFQVQPWIFRIDMLIELKRYDEAVKIADEAEKYFPNHPKIEAVRLRALGSQAYALRKSNKSKSERLKSTAIKTAKSLIAKNPNRAELHIQLGRLYYIDGEAEKAQQSFEEAVKQSAKGDGEVRIESRVWLGRILLKADEMRAALKSLGDATKVNGGSSIAFYWLGRAFQKDDKERLAKQAFEKAIELDMDGSYKKRAEKALESLE